MKKNSTILLIIVTIFSIISFMSSNANIKIKIINIVVVSLILILELLKDITKINKLLLIALNIILITSASILKFNGLEYLIPIVLFNALGSLLRFQYLLSIIFLISIVLYKENIFNISLYNVIVTLYLYEAKAHYESNRELKEYNRGFRNEKRILHTKLMDLEKSLEQNNIVSSLKERNFIAQKLHDYIGHRITSSLMQLEVTKEMMEVDSATSKKYLNSAIDNLREGMEEIRGVLKNFKPLDKVLGIEEIRELLFTYQYNTGIKTHIDLSGDTQRINFKTWCVLEENLKEALTNTAKYANATEFTISIFIYNKFIRVEMKDNGIGFNDIIEKNLGLRGMEERITKLGGTIDFYNNNGFIIKMIINLEDLNVN